MYNKNNNNDYGEDVCGTRGGPSSILNNNNDKGVFFMENRPPSKIRGIDAILNYLQEKISYVNKGRVVIAYSEKKLEIINNFNNHLKLTRTWLPYADFYTFKSSVSLQRIIIWRNDDQVYTIEVVLER